ncbi:CitMHS family transporter [Fretibacterium sp. OH1220_COT-178]|uniref:CitMHS family transporter n=1 Tax=Fretibacterium sp. OH1220_COT-178 TaxID=2491047 RepID=UPI0018F40A7C|nr:citrate:proton symporter [Fretibacterium sp. OH1220_COT-178]
MLLPLVGYLMIFVIVALLLKGKMTPIVVLVVVPFLAALLLGYNPVEIAGFIKKGVSTTMNTAILLFFSVIFFGVMSDVGVFDIVVDFLVKKAGMNVVAITTVTAIVAIIAHLDGATATTVLITIPAMYPIFRRLGIRPVVLLCITAAGMGVMNLVPWGGPTARVATVLKMDATAIWHMLIPIQIVGAVLTVTLGAVLGVIEKRRLAAVGAPSLLEAREPGEDPLEKKEGLELRRPGLLLWNVGLTLLVIGVLVANLMTAYVVFLLGLCVALMLNYRTLKEQDGRIKAHAPSAFVIGATMISAGAMVGILNETGMMEAMARTLLGIIPPALGGYIHMIFGVFALPLGMMIGTDAYFYGIFPLVAEVAAQYGVTPLNTGLTMIIGKNVGLMISPLVPATYLAIGLVDVELKEHIRFSFKWLISISLLMLCAGVLLGIIRL